MSVVILFVLGTLVGSFLNVVGTRWGSGRTILGRSSCPHCNKTLKWWELVPIFSFLIQKGRCRSCGKKISYQYPIIEIWTGLIFLSIYNLQFTIYKEFNTLFIVHCALLLVVFSIYVVITIYDFHHKIIPDGLVYTSIFLSILVPLFIIHYSLLDWLTGPIIFLFFAAIWLLSRGRAMGFGDAKLGLSIGLLLGAAQGLSAIILAFWIGAVYSLAYIFIKNDKGLTMKSEVPFAPFIIIGAWVSIVFHINLLHVATI